MRASYNHSFIHCYKSESSELRQLLKSLILGVIGVMVWVGLTVVQERKVVIEKLMFPGHEKNLSQD